MKLKITWLNNGFVQIKYLVHCRENRQGYITMNSPIYEAIADGSFVLDLGFGRHPFLIDEISN
jgi:hypothetical protein